MHRIWIDRWRGLLILLVVLGHAVGGGGNLAEGNASCRLLELWRIVYLFHMPAFFTLAGFCWKHGAGQSFAAAFRRFAARKFIRLLIPYFVFGLLSWLVYDAVFGRWEDFGLQMWHLLIAKGDYTCNSVLWFLPTMFLVVLASFAIDCMIGKPQVASLAGISAMAFAAFFLLRYNHISDLPFMLFRVLKYLFYFLLGRIAGLIAVGRARDYVFKKFSCLPRMVRSPLGRLAAAGILIVLFVGFSAAVHPDTRPIGGFTLWMMQGVVGALLSAMVARALPDRPFRWLEWVGGMSMGIMLVHKFPLIAVQEHVPFVRAMFGVDSSLAFAGAVIVSGFSTVCAIAATLFIRRFAPWTIGERKCTC